MPFRRAVALTGGIATGKSSVAAYLHARGFALIDADSVAHTVLDREASQIAMLFGEALLREGRVDRKALGAIVFGDLVKRKALESLLHPLIYEEILRQSRLLASQHPLYFIDIPLFFEGGRYAIDRSIVVYATPQQQLTRLMRRDSLTQAQARQRIEAQMDIEQKRQRATWVIDNTGTRQALQAKCDKILQQLQTSVGAIA